jgi:hypothetical protein
MIMRDHGTDHGLHNIPGSTRIGGVVSTRVTPRSF